MTYDVIPLRDLDPIQPAGVSNEAALVPSESEWRDLFGLQAPASGLAVTPTSAQRVATVYACVTRIAGGISSMPLRIYERVWDESAGVYGRKPVDDIDLWWLLNERPTAATTAASGWELITQSMLLRGDGFKWLRRARSGKLKEIIPLDWSVVTPKRLERFGRLMYAVNDGYSITGVDQDDMLHFPGFGFDGERAPSVITYAARNGVGNALAMDEFSGRFFRNGAHHNIVLETDGKMDEEAIRKLQLVFAEKYSGVENAHKRPLVLTEKMKARTLSVSAQDAQLLDARKYQVHDICRAFGVPPHMVGETSASTSWGSGLESMGRGFVTYTLNPPLRRFEQELNHKLFRTPRFYVEFDRSALWQGDSKARADADKAALGGPGAGPGYKSVDEIRREHNLPPLGGRYKEPYWPPDKAAGAGNPKPPRPDQDEGDHEPRPGERP